ncbi:hypothetical protein ACP70R_026437 [Stipagrostis hirtigluma subsp. patula]
MPWPASPLPQAHHQFLAVPATKSRGRRGGTHGEGHEGGAGGPRAEGQAWPVAFAAVVVAAARRFVDWVVSGDWMSWWLFWRPGRRLQIDEADANPKDAAKHSVLLHELNNFRE